LKRIGLLSDTHGYLHQEVYHFFALCDEIWHAGDIGNSTVADELNQFKPLKAVSGNIDGADIRSKYPEHLEFYCENISVWINHTGGYPGRYSQEIKSKLNIHPPKLFISGHSHILKIIYDKKFGLLHINPGAAGIFGFHKKITLVRFNINIDKISDLEINEIKKVY